MRATIVRRTSPQFRRGQHEQRTEMGRISASSLIGFRAQGPPCILTHTLRRYLSKIPIKIALCTYRHCYHTTFAIHFRHSRYCLLLRGRRLSESTAREMYRRTSDIPSFLRRSTGQQRTKISRLRRSQRWIQRRGNKNDSYALV